MMPMMQVRPTININATRPFPRNCTVSLILYVGCLRKLRAQGNHTLSHPLLEGLTKPHTRSPNCQLYWETRSVLSIPLYCLHIAPSKHGLFRLITGPIWASPRSFRKFETKVDPRVIAKMHSHFDHSNPQTPKRNPNVIPVDALAQDKDWHSQ